MKRITKYFAALIVLVMGFPLIVLGSGKGPSNQGPTGSVEHKGHYYRYFSTQLSWQEADTYCRLIGGHLANVSDEEENAVLTSLVRSGSAFLGANDLEEEGRFAWCTGEPFTYTNWAAGEPNNNGNQDLLHLYASGQWDDVGNQRLGFLCEWDSFAPTSEIPADAIPYDGTYYKLYKNAFDYEAAMLFCELQGGHLVTITSRRESEVVAQVADGNIVWLGGNDVQEEGKFVWCTGERFSYRDWKGREPDNWWNEEDHMVMNEDGKWGDNPQSKTHYFVCEWGISPKRIPVGWIIAGGIIGGLILLICITSAVAKKRAKNAPPPPPRSEPVSRTESSTESSYHSVTPSREGLENSQYYKEAYEKYYNMYMGYPPKKDDSVKRELDVFEEAWLMTHVDLSDD